MVETKEVKSVWYTVLVNGNRLAMRDVVIELPGGELEMFKDPSTYPIAVALNEIIAQ